MTAVYPCECGAAKAEHQGGTYWCRHLDCSCKRYTPDFAAAETADIVARAQADPDQPALSAQLRRVEQERDELAVRAADLEQVREELKQLRLLADGYLEDIQHLESGQDEVIDSLRRQRDEALAKRDQATENGDWWMRQCRLHQAELASARTELDRLRSSYSGWIVARDGGRHCERCEGEVRRGEAYTEQPGTGGLIQHIHCPTEGES